MFEKFYMDGWWYVVKNIGNEHKRVYLKTKSENEARHFYTRLAGKVSHLQSNSLLARASIARQQGGGMIGLAGNRPNSIIMF